MKFPHKTRWEKNKWGAPKLVEIEDVDIDGWFRVLRISECSSSRNYGYDREKLLLEPDPAVKKYLDACGLCRVKNLQSRDIYCLFSVHRVFGANPDYRYQHRGVWRTKCHFSLDYVKDTPSIQYSGPWNATKIRARMLALVAYNAIQPSIPKKLWRFWILRMVTKLERYLDSEKLPPFKFPAPFNVYVELCHDMYEEISHLTLCGSLQRIEDELPLLMKHISQEDWTDIWRSHIVEAVMGE